MLLGIKSKSKNYYELEWMGSLGDFVKHLENTEEKYIKVMDNFGNKSLLKISEIEAVSIV